MKTVNKTLPYCYAQDNSGAPKIKLMLVQFETIELDQTDDIDRATEFQIFPFALPEAQPLIQLIRQLYASAPPPNQQPG